MRIIRAFVIWITFQLVFLGWMEADIFNQIQGKRFNCNAPYTAPEFFTYIAMTVLPIGMFIPETGVVEYCKDKR